MAQSPKLRFYSGFKEDKQKTTTTSNEPDNVQGWLMNVHTYGNPEDTLTIVDEDNNSIPIGFSRKNRNGRPGSIASEDSVNLEELINANFTTDMDDETDLPDLGALDLDDSTDEFWKLENNESLDKLNTDPDRISSTKAMGNDYDYDWSPVENVAEKKSGIPTRPKRSGSLSSENSLTSQSTITHYAKYGLAPIYPSESTSTSSRSLSRLSNYSATSNRTIGIPTPSRSYTRDETRPASKRASHIPAPTTPTPQRTLSSNTRLRVPAKRIPQRASHIPTVRESIHRPGSPLQQPRIRSPTPGPRNSLFPPAEEKRVLSPTPRASGLRPPGSSIPTTKSTSRIGTLKRSK